MTCEPAENRGVTALTTLPSADASADAVRERRRLAQLMDRLLGAVAILALRTQTTMWSVVGAHLWPLRDALADQQQQLDARVDGIAARMRELGAFPGGAFDGWQELSTVTDLVDEVAGSSAVRHALHELVSDHEHAAGAARAARDAVAAAGDAPTAELLAAIEHDLERMRWTLRSMAATLFNTSRSVVDLERVA